jgi:peptidyl-Lys metalloendopeptidase
MRKNRLAAVLSGLLALAAAGSAQAEIRARLAVDKTWLGETDDVVAKVVITNRGERAVRVPGWQVPGATLDANLFDVTRDGEPVAYLGRMLKRGAAQPGDFVTLQPGQSVRGRTELTGHYDMVDGGEYLVSYRLDLMDGVEIEGMRSEKDMVDSNAVAIWREGPVRGPLDFDALYAPLAGTTKSLAFSGACSSSEQSAISTAVNNGTSYAGGAKTYLQGKTWSTVGPRYTTWFGTASSSNFTTVTNHFIAIQSAFQNQAVVVDCSCSDNYYAYVYPTQPYKIYVCNAFWSAPATGTDSKAGTLVHEMSHFNVVAGTDDWAYGQTACKSLAKKKPSRAIDNADSHEYFAENTPAQN